ncbi:MAG: UDP-N-acetylmuramoyl-tripeptide--D-alanyl-D-alanine ligase [Saprospiraceae bacterium]|nr:UDP-N-acetylmuramoyl-tripeptide--D-alanyl-D-alanine ligase [Saprospiraceae bacterium]
MTEIQNLYEYYLRYPQICIDSRKVEAGVLFFALKGDRFDGHDFAGKALEDGAAFAVVQDAQLAEGNDQMLLVEDTLTALQDLATFHRRKLAVPVLAITGSNGKTTTKELVAAVLQARYPVLATFGNFNNHIGVPLTLLKARPEHEILIIEMGANHVGEIAALCRIAEPSHGLITNIGKAHLEGFGGIEGVKKGKSELYQYLANSNGIAFVNQDEDFLEALSDAVEKRVFYAGGTGKFAATVVRESPFLEVSFDPDNRIQTHLIGIYNFPNILTAIAIGQYFKVKDTQIVEAISNYIPNNNRSQLIQLADCLVILDAYNANPTSMTRAIQAFAERPEKRKWAILGDMLELGIYSESEHKALLKLAKAQGFEQLITVGPAFRNAALTAGIPHFMDVHALKIWWDAQDRTSVCALLKASRGIRLEQLINS